MTIFHKNQKSQAIKEPESIEEFKTVRELKNFRTFSIKLEIDQIELRISLFNLTILQHVLLLRAHL